LRTIKVSVGERDYLVNVTRDETEIYRYTGRCVELPGAISEGKTLKELKENMKEVIKTTRDISIRKAATLTDSIRRTAKRRDSTSEMRQWRD
jgi:predicted RNase H-like HicB family nuclease